MRRFLFIILVGIILFSSCSRKRLVLLQTKEKEVDYTEYIKKDQEYRLKVYDMIDVRVTSPNQEIASMFNLWGQNVNGGGNNMNNNNNNMMNNNMRGGRGGQSSYNMAQMNGYVVNDTGYVKLPVFGEIKIEGMTVPELNKKVQELADEYLEDATVRVILLSFKIVFMGEAGNQIVYFDQPRLNILEALTRAGITDNIYGRNKKALIVRPTKEGHLTYRVDLTQRGLLESEKFYLMPNDMVYIEPTFWKLIKFDLQEFFFYLSTITTLYLLIKQ